MKKKQKKIFIRAFVITLFVLLIVYLAFSLHFKSHFYFNSYINGINYGNMTVKEAEQHIKKDISNYVLEINGRNGITDIISAGDIHYKYIPDDSIQKLMNKQNPFKWVISLYQDSTNDMQITTSYDKEKLQAKIKSLPFIKAVNNKAPVNAYIEYQSDSYKIVPENPGSQIIQSKLTSMIIDAIAYGNRTINLDETNCYETPTITQKSKKLITLLEKLNIYCQLNICYDFEYTTEKVDSSFIRDWLEINDDLEVTFNLEKVRTYINSIAKIYNTYGKTRNFINHNDKLIEVSGGDYGWLINRSKEVEHLVETIKNEKDAIIQPIYFQMAKARQPNDIGDSYIEISLKKQHVWVYQYGQLMFDTDCVTGNTTKGHDTPTGIFQITYKEKNATLTGENYSSPVTYWMPFYYNVGLHDATWRSKFGGDIYKKSGSHGCINLPYDAAEKIYQYIDKGTPVVCYH